MYDFVDKKIWKDLDWVEHVFEEDSRRHVLYYTDKGILCKEKNCIYNAPKNIWRNYAKIVDVA